MSREGFKSGGRQKCAKYSSVWLDQKMDGSNHLRLQYQNFRAIECGYQESGFLEDFNGGLIRNMGKRTGRMYWIIANSDT